MTRSIAPYAEALVAVAAIAWLTSALLPVLGIASSALLFLLPVLPAATRGGVGPGLLAALSGAGAYNYFLLEPRFTFRVHQLENLVSVFVLGAVALVTSRLATRLLAREAEANERARSSAEAAELSTLLASDSPDEALHKGLDFLTARFGAARLVSEADLAGNDAAFSSLDRAAAAWAIHNGDRTGHGTETMVAADWSFVPLAPRNRNEGVIVALARPADGSTRTAAELDHAGQLCLLLGQCRDRANLAAERRERELAETSDQLRRTFLASLAHDFRTPLTVIEGRLELLARDHAEAGDALAATRRLDRTMNNLLGAARIEAGSLAPARESLDLVDVAGAACDALVAPASIAIERSIPAYMPFVSGDAILLHHVLVNLLDNACRHARARVTISADRTPDRALLAIEDDGDGIAEADRTRIFERFSRIEGSDRTHGSGLGLAIVKGFAEAMGMTVTAGSRTGGGARFELAMPFAAMGKP